MSGRRHDRTGGPSASRGRSRCATACRAGDGPSATSWSRPKLAMVHGRPAVGVRPSTRARTRTRCGSSSRRCARGATSHGERFAGADPDVERTADGFVFEHAYRVRGPGFDPSGATWWRGDRHREEAARGLNDRRGRLDGRPFRAPTCDAGDVLPVEAWADDLSHGAASLRAGAVIIDAARQRADDVVAARSDRRAISTSASSPSPRISSSCARRADRPSSRAIPGSATGRATHSRRTRACSSARTAATRDVRCSSASAATVSEGMLANTADAGGLEYNTVDAAPWFLHAARPPRRGHRRHRHRPDAVARCHADRRPPRRRHALRHQGRSDGLITQGAEGWALDMDGRACRRHAGDAARRASRSRSTPCGSARLRVARYARARRSRSRNACWSEATRDVVSPPVRATRRTGPARRRRPRRRLGPSQSACSPCRSRTRRSTTRRATAAVVRACVPLRHVVRTALPGPGRSRYTGRHRGGAGRARPRLPPGNGVAMAARSVRRRVPPSPDTARRRDRRTRSAHIADWGVGSVSETADGDAPHRRLGLPVPGVVGRRGVASEARCDRR